MESLPHLRIPSCGSHGPHTERAQTAKIKPFPRLPAGEGGGGRGLSHSSASPWERKTFSPFHSFKVTHQFFFVFFCFTSKGSDNYRGPIYVPERGMTCLDVTQGISSDDTRGFPPCCQAPGFRVCINTADTPVFDTATLSDLSTCCFIALLSNHSYFPHCDGGKKS